MKTRSLVGVLALSIALFSVSLPAFAETVTTTSAVTLKSLYNSVKSLESRIMALEVEVSLLKKENADLRLKLVGTGSVALAPAATAVSTGSVAAVATVPSSKAPSLSGLATDKKYSAIVEYVSANLPAILAKNSVNATGSVGLFEFVEPDSFFVSIDDGNNPTGVTAFKTKVLFKYDTALTLSVTGVFDLDYSVEKYVTVRGSNPFAKVTRVRVKNPAYKGKLLEETETASAGTTSASANGTSSVPNVTTSTGTTASSTTATVENVRAAYDKNKLSDTIRLATSYLQTSGNNVEVLTMRARSYYIMGNLEQAIADIKTIYSIKKDDIDCGIVNDAARAEKTLKWAGGTFFTDIQTAKKCKK